MNAISPSDVGLSEQLGLSDAWINRAGKADQGDGSVRQEDEELGHTWGYQPPSVFPPGRLDKILFIGDLKVDDVQRVGVGLNLQLRMTQKNFALGSAINMPYFARLQYGR
jgi:tyrosyl-DNA phosphodiesterase 2